MFIGDATNANFADLNSIYIRWKYNSTSSATVAIGDIIVWQKGVGPVASTSIAVPVKEAAAGEVTVRFVYNTEDNAYRIYMNGARVTTPTVEVAMTAHLNAMENKYLTVNGSYETDGVGGAWLEGDESTQEITIVSIGGKKVVNKAPELVTNAIAITGTVTHESVTLNWEKAEYPNGAMDSYNFVAVGYVIERYNLTDEDPEATITVEGGIETLTYTDTGLNAESRYFYNGYAVDAEDYLGLADAVEKFIGSDWMALGKKSREYFDRNYRRENFFDKLIDELEKNL
jgi:hypothetical protein